MQLHSPMKRLADEIGERFAAVEFGLQLLAGFGDRVAGEHGRAAGRGLAAIEHELRVGRNLPEDCGRQTGRFDRELDAKREQALAHFGEAGADVDRVGRLRP